MTVGMQGVGPPGLSRGGGAMAAAATGGAAPVLPPGGPAVPEHISVTNIRFLPADLIEITVYVPGRGAGKVVMNRRLLTVEAVNIAAHVFNAIATGG